LGTQLLMCNITADSFLIFNICCFVRLFRPNCCNENYGLYLKFVSLALKNVLAFALELVYVLGLGLGHKVLDNQTVATLHQVAPAQMTLLSPWLSE